MANRIVDVPAGTVFRVVNADMLEHDLCSGWNLMERFEESILLYGSDTVLESAEALKSRGYSIGSATVAKSYLGTVSKFLLKKDVNTVIEELQRSLDHVGSDRAAIVDARLDAEKELATAIKLLDEKTDEVKFVREKETARAEELNAVRSARQKMEADIGKLRQAFGEIRVKEILEGTAK